MTDEQKKQIETALRHAQNTRLVLSCVFGGLFVDASVAKKVASIIDRLADVELDLEGLMVDFNVPGVNLDALNACIRK